jgi:hypothetical protein
MGNSSSSTSLECGWHVLQVICIHYFIKKCVFRNPSNNSHQQNLLAKHETILDSNRKIQMRFFFFPQVLPNSPGEKAGLEPYFDFIVSINGHRLVIDTFLFGRDALLCLMHEYIVIRFESTFQDREDSKFATLLRENINKEVTLSVYNSKTEKLRGELIFFRLTCLCIFLLS